MAAAPLTALGAAPLTALLTALVSGTAACLLAMPAQAAPIAAAASAARVPAAAVVAGPALPPAVARALRASGLPLGSFGLHVRQVDGPVVLASLNAEGVYSLASTTKLVTTLAALEVLGPRFRWRTEAFATGPLVHGRLLGDLVIVGGGDATLASADLRAWFAELRAKGVREVWGDIVLQRAAFQLGADDHALTPEPTAARPHHMRPDALMLDEGVLRVTLQSAPGGGAHPSVRFTPPLSDLAVVDRLRAGPRCAAAAVYSADTEPPRLVLTGEWRAGCGSQEIALAPLSHAQFTARAVAGLWREAGGVLKGRVREPPPAQRLYRVPLDAEGEALAPLSVHASAPLGMAIRGMNKSSNNVLARTLMLSMVPGFPSVPATMVQARERMAQWLQSRGLQPDDLVVENGSGLSHAERGRPRALVDLLRQAWNGRQSQIFVDSLPVAGLDGTLAHRLQHGEAAGRAWLKTGTLNDTRALAGYVRGRSGRVYALAALVNHAQAARATPALDALVEWIARNG